MSVAAPFLRSSPGGSCSLRAMSNADPNWYAPPMANAPPRSTEEEETSLVPVGFGVRAFARILDTFAAMLFGMIGGAMGGFIGAVLAQAGLLQPGWLQRIQGVSVGSFLFGALASLLYHALSESLGGASIGKA